MCAEKVAEIYRKTNERRMGIPAVEIAFIHDASTEKRRERLFSDVREGGIRVLIGSTFKLGMGG